MAAHNSTDPRIIAYLSENYEKEKWLRMYWVNRHSEGLKRATTLNREPTNYRSADIKESVIAAGMLTITRDHLVAAGNRRKVRVKDIDLVKLDKDMKLEPAMMPVSEEEKKVFYKGCKDEYLNIRKVIPPDKKYHFIECSSWKHGWQFDKSEIKLRGPAYGKIYHLLRMRGLGPQPDPPHYQDCKEISNLCTDIGR